MSYTQPPERELPIFSEADVIEAVLDIPLDQAITVLSALDSLRQGRHVLRVSEGVTQAGPQLVHCDVYETWIERKNYGTRSD